MMTKRLLFILGILLATSTVTSGCGNAQQHDALLSSAPSSDSADGHGTLNGNGSSGAFTAVNGMPVNGMMIVASKQAAANERAEVEKSVVNDVHGAGSEVALTFDDGPDNKYTPQILDILQKAGVKATFFVIGEHAVAYPNMIERMVNEGHVVGNHSWDHPDLVKLEERDIRIEITKTDDVLFPITHQPTTLLRAPYGAVPGQVVAEAKDTGHQLIGWSVDTMDWDGLSVRQILANVKKEVGPGAIILQHCAGGKNGNLKNTVEALPQIIANLQTQGYNFVTVPELIASQKDQRTQQEQAQQAKKAPPTKHAAHVHTTQVASAAQP